MPPTVDEMRDTLRIARLRDIPKSLSKMTKAECAVELERLGLSAKIVERPRDKDGVMIKKKKNGKVNGKVNDKVNDKVNGKKKATKPQPKDEVKTPSILSKSASDKVKMLSRNV